MRLQGWISGRDFAHSVVSCARLKHVDSYLDKCQVGGCLGAQPARKVHTASDAYKVAGWQHGVQRGQFAHRHLVAAGSNRQRGTGPRAVGAAWLAALQAMPPELAGLQVTFQDFKQFREVWAQLRMLSGVGRGTGIVCCRVGG